MNVNWRYRAGDLVAGIGIGGVVALTHHFLVPESLGIVLGAILGMLVGMGAQMLASLFLGGILGSIEMMVPGMFVGMLGMVPPILGLHNLWVELWLGVSLGFLVFLGFAIWDGRTQGMLQSVRHPYALEKSSPPTVKSSPASAGWWNAPWFYDVLEEAGNRRRASAQRQLFRTMHGRVLFVAAGTGLNFPQFPPGKNIVAIDLSPPMLEAARARAERYDGDISLEQADVQQLPFAGESFDTAASASTFCSVADPVKGLRELYRVLKPGGTLLMFEHVRSRNPVLGAELYLLNLALRYLGPSMNRDTVGNVQRAGFVVDRVVCAYLDIFLAIEAHKPELEAAGAPERS